MKHLFLIFILALSSCGGYFRDLNNKTGQSVQPLAIAGGGYLSSDTANEISPFVFHDPATGKNYIVFSSDRSGNYDLYYSEMYPDSTFSNPVQFGSNLNTTSNEVSGVLFRALDGSTTNLYLTVLRNNSLSNTNIICYQLNSNFTYASVRHDTSIIARYLTVTPGISPDMIYSTNGTNFLEIGWSSGGNIGWYGGIVNKTIGINSNLIHSVGLGFSSISGGLVGSNYILACLISGRYQLYIGSIWIVPSVVSNAELKLFASRFNDRDPFVDMLDNYKVYFSSDRFGKGNYDMYRYNILTFDRVQTIP